MTFYIFNDEISGTNTLTVQDIVDPQNPLPIQNPSYPGALSFPLVAGDTAGPLTATATTPQGTTGNVQWTAVPGTKQPVVVEDGKTYFMTNGFEKS